MPTFISEKVQETLADPNSSEVAELVIGVEEGHINEISNEIESQGGSIIREIPFNKLFVHLPETSISHFTDQENITSIEYNETISVLTEGN